MTDFSGDAAAFTGDAAAAVVAATGGSDGGAPACDAAQPAKSAVRRTDSGGVVGVLALTWYDVPSGRKAWIEDVVVDAAARGLGW